MNKLLYSESIKNTQYQFCFQWMIKYTAGQNSISILLLETCILYFAGNYPLLFSTFSQTIMPCPKTSILIGNAMSISTGAEHLHSF